MPGPTDPKRLPRFAEEDGEWPASLLTPIEQGEPPLGHDPVEAPLHYRIGGIECLDFIESWGLDFLSGNVIKYVVRAPYKGNKVEDLRKAKFYIERLIAKAEGK